MEASCTVQTYRNSCKFFSESDKKKMTRAISKNQVSDPGPSWPSILAHLSTTCSRGAFSVVMCPSCVVNNFFKHLLLLKRWANLDQTWQECSLVGPF